MEQLVVDMSKRLKTFVDKRHGQNISQAAHHLNEDYHLVYRLYHERQKTIDFTPACNILSQIAPDEYRTMLGEYFPDDLRKLQKLISPREPNPIAALNQKVLPFFQSEMGFKIYVLLLSGLEVTVSDIKEELGRQGIAEMERLEKEGALKIDENRKVGTEVDEFIKPTQDIIKKHLQFQLGNVDMNIPGTQIENLTGAVTKENLQKIYAILSEAVARVKEIIEHDKGKGDIIMLSSLFCGPFSTRAEELK